MNTDKFFSKNRLTIQAVFCYSVFVSKKEKGKEMQNLKEKAREICEEKYQESREYGELGLKADERLSVSQWVSLAENFAKLFDCEEDYFLGIN